MTIASGLALAGKARGDIVYDVNLSIGSGGVAGTITTDGAIGLLGASDIIAWNLTVTGISGTSINLVSSNGLSGVEVGNNTDVYNPSAGTPDLTADAMNIYFDFSGTDGGYFGFQTLPFYGGQQYFSCGANNNSDSAQGFGVVPVLYSDPTSIYVAESGTQIIATAATPGTQPSSFLYNNFAQTRLIQFNGSATATTTGDGPVLELTAAGANQTGSAFTANPLVLNANGSFATFFTFRLGQPGGAIPQGGIAFSIQSSGGSSLGGTGSGLGYSGISNSLAVSFNLGTNGAAPANRIAVDLNGLINEPVWVEITNAPLNNGNIWYCWIDYDGIRSLLEARLSDQPLRPATPVLTAVLNLPGVLGNTTTAPLKAYVGFTGGGASQQDILSWRFMGLPITRFTGVYNLTNVSASYRLTNAIALKLYTYVVNGVTYTNAYSFQEQLIPQPDGSLQFQTEAEATPVVGAGGQQESELMASLSEYVDSSSGTPVTGVATPVTTPVPVGQTFEQSFPGTTESQAEALVEGLSAIPPPLPAPPTDLNQAIALQTAAMNELIQTEQYRQEVLTGIINGGSVAPAPPSPLVNQVSEEQQAIDQVNQALQLQIQAQMQIANDIGSYSTATDVGTVNIRQQIISGPPPTLLLLSPQVSSTNLSFGLLTASNLSYTIWTSTNLAGSTWSIYTNFVSDGYPKTIRAPSAGLAQSYYRASSP